MSLFLALKCIGVYDFPLHLLVVFFKLGYPIPKFILVPTHHLLLLLQSLLLFEVLLQVVRDSLGVLLDVNVTHHRPEHLFLSNYTLPEVLILILAV